MRWQTPEVFEVKMDAEIGSYQVDDERDEAPPFATTSVEAVAGDDSAR